MIDVRWWPAAMSTVEALEAHLGRGSRAGHLCPRCGSDAHGRPWARRGDERVAASASRAGDWLVTAVRIAGEGEIGIDVEVVRDPGLDARLVGHPDDALEDPALELATWVRKEAIVKMLGTGLRRDPSTILLADHDVRAVAAPAGLIAFVCVGVSQREAARAAPAARARR